MYANFTEETATSAGDVLTLTGASSDNIPFSASFTDGDNVAYVATDSSGNKVAGIGTYSAGTITRNDNWNYNGTTVDKNPSTNIALTGDVVVRSDVTAHNLFNNKISHFSQSIRHTHVPPKGYTGGSYAAQTAFCRVDYIIALPVTYERNFFTDELSYDVRSISSSNDARMQLAIYVVDNSPSVTTARLIANTEEIDVSALATTGMKNVSLDKTILIEQNKAYLFCFLSNDDEATFRGTSDVSSETSFFGTNFLFNGGEGVTIGIPNAYDDGLPVSFDIEPNTENSGDYRMPVFIPKYAGG